MSAKTIITTAGVIGALLLGACAGNEFGTKETAGTLLGAAGGGLLGSQVGSGSGQLVGVAIGTLAGAYLGREVGKSLDRADRLAMQQAQTKALASPVGQRIVWRNPDSGNSGAITALREGTDTRSGATCREFQNTVTVGGEPTQGVGIACRQADGSWKILQ